MNPAWSCRATAAPWIASGGSTIVRLRSVLPTIQATEHSLVLTSRASMMHRSHGPRPPRPRYPAFDTAPLRTWEDGLEEAPSEQQNRTDPIARDARCHLGPHHPGSGWA